MSLSNDLSNALGSSISRFFYVFRKYKQIRKISYIVIPLFATVSFFFIVLLNVSNKPIIPESYKAGAILPWGIILLYMAILGKYYEIKEIISEENETRVKQEEVRKNPEKAKLAWELAQDKLENYLNRNLSQVRSMFTICIVVMILGFGLILFGVYCLYNDQSKITPSLLSATSGILVSFLAGTFLLMYKSTMAQAKDYVMMLERINAVGMSMQILDSLDDAKQELKEQTKADIAKELLSIYAKR